MVTGSLRSMTKVRREEELARRFAAVGLKYVTLWQGTRYTTKTEYILYFRAAKMGGREMDYELSGVSGWNRGVLHLDTLEAVTADPAVLRHATWSVRHFAHQAQLKRHDATKLLTSRLERYGSEAARDLLLSLNPGARGADEKPAQRRKALAEAKKRVVEAQRALAKLDATVEALCGPEPFRPASPYDLERAAQVRAAA